MKTLTNSLIKVFAVIILTATSVTVLANPCAGRKLTKQNRILPDFTEIEAGSNFIVKVIQGNFTKVAVESDAASINNIETTVINNRLLISYSGANTPDLMKVYIQMPELRKLSIYGSAKLETTGTISGTSLELNADDECTVKINMEVTSLISCIGGNAKAELSGVAGLHKARISGIAQMDALRLETVTTDATVSGAAISGVYASVNITADISQAGMLCYYDNGVLMSADKTRSFEIIPLYTGSEQVKGRKGESSIFSIRPLPVYTILSDAGINESGYTSPALLYQRNSTHNLFIRQ